MIDWVTGSHFPPDGPDKPRWHLRVATRWHLLEGSWAAAHWSLTQRNWNLGPGRQTSHGSCGAWKQLGRSLDGAKSSCFKPGHLINHWVMIGPWEERALCPSQWQWYHWAILRTLSPAGGESREDCAPLRQVWASSTSVIHLYYYYYYWFRCYTSSPIDYKHLEKKQLHCFLKHSIIAGTVLGHGRHSVDIWRRVIKEGRSEGREGKREGGRKEGIHYYSLNQH